MFCYNYLGGVAIIISVIKLRLWFDFDLLGNYIKYLFIVQTYLDVYDFYALNLILWWQFTKIVSWKKVKVKYWQLLLFQHTKSSSSYVFLFNRQLFVFPLSSSLKVVQNSFVVFIRNSFSFFSLWKCMSCGTWSMCGLSIIKW